jgi:hypothetical protein
MGDFAGCWMSAEQRAAIACLHARPAQLTKVERESVAKVCAKGAASAGMQGAVVYRCGCLGYVFSAVCGLHLWVPSLVLLKHSIPGRIPSKFEG